MNEPDDVLERNLRRLFTRAYRPVVPTAEFRARLVRRLETRPTADRAPLQPVRPRRLENTVLAAAALIVVTLGVAYLVLRSTRAVAADPEAMLARGSVLVRESGDRGWREIEAETAARGLELPFEDQILVRTPAHVSIELREASSAVVTIAPASSASVDTSRNVSRRTVDLQAGAVRIQNLAGKDWTLLGPDGADVLLSRGTLSARLESSAPPETGLCLVVVLENGAGSAYAGGYVLQVGVETTLHDGRVLSAATAPADGTTASARASAATTGAEAPDPAQTAIRRDGFASLVGAIVRSSDEDRIGRYSVTILRKERLPAVATPKRYEFDGAERFSIHPVRPGTYDVYVERAGHVPWIARGIEIASNATHELTVTSSSGASLAGRVVAARDGTPIANALVIVEDLVPAQVILFDAAESAWSAAARTNSAGEFVLEHIPPGPHVLRATAPGFAAVWHSIATIEPNQSLEMRLGIPGSIAGSVSKEDGSPWAGAIVIASFMRTDGDLSRFSYGAGSADGDGTYSIHDLPAGDYVILNVLDTSSGRESMAAKQVHVEAGAVTTVNLPDKVDGPRFSGRVLDAAGTALGGLDITLQPSGVRDSSSWRSQRVAPDGRFSFIGIPAGGYDVFLGENLGEHFAAADQVVVPPGGLLEYDVRLGAGAIRGRASSKDITVANAFVLLERMERDDFQFAGRARTDANGAFGFDHLQPATYRATVFPAQRGFAPSRSADLWVAANSAPVDCELTVERGAALTVLVRAHDGSPAANVALVFVDGAGKPQRFGSEQLTDAAGRFAIDNIAAGTWHVAGLCSAGRTNTVQIELSVGDDRDVVLELP